jgi:hypothetical protein
MKPLFHSNCPIWPLGAAFGPETGLFPRKTPPPFPAGASLDAAGAEFRPVGAPPAVVGAEFPPAGASLIVAGAEFRRVGAPLDGAGAEFRQPGGSPISQTEAPAARSGAPVARSGHPVGQRGRLGDKEMRRLRRPESAGLRVCDARGAAVLPLSKSPHLQVFFQ